ncbi:hypothetical protein SLS62_007548 [Diatrype stigma]|uniref:Uncharacterized protein n=1 Tax=Diatrype stigma TaxID=117547 RepID=A0AAN9YQK5_9PEZI
MSQEDLLETLLAHDGSVNAASSSLTERQSRPSRQVIKGQGKGAVGCQTSLRFFVSKPLGRDASGASKKPRLLSRKGTTLHLYDPVDIAEHTPCSIIHNFLPQEEADALLEEMLKESGSFEKITFKLFDNVVSSPHTSTFYVETQAELNTQVHDYFYNGAKLTIAIATLSLMCFCFCDAYISDTLVCDTNDKQDVRKITPQLLRVKPRVQGAVNAEIQHRIETKYPNGQKLKFQSSGPWLPNAAFVNCYNGPQESVGYHSDQLTYLGPRAIIGSLSLGVAREFRVRRIVPKDASVSNNNSAEGGDADARGQISIHLPHNSLLVMHAEMQEEWKHCIAPAQAIDPHPIAGNRRINVTYRYYKPSFHPRHTARCKCGIPAILRVVQRKKESHGKYFWMCHGGNVPGKQNCDFFQWADFDDDGNPNWDKDRYKKSQPGAMSSTKNLHDK